MIASDADSTAIPRYVVASKWIWLVGPAIGLAGPLVLVAQNPGDGLALALFVWATITAALAIPAALMLSRRKRWARIVLIWLALSCLAALHQAFVMAAWVSLVLNLVLGSTYVMLQDSRVREFFGVPLRTRLR